jgi:predicted  nucleic acid-binding Zn-ribbon protein
MSQTLSLYRLQQIDTQIDRLQARLQAIQKILDDETELRQLIDQYDTAELRCQIAENALKQAETDVQNQFIKLEQTRSNLYAAKSHSPKELLDLQNDVSALKRFLAVLEDRQLEAMQESETAEADRQIAQSKVEHARSERSEKNQNLLHEQTNLNIDLERFFIERNAVSGPIPSTEIGLYDQLRLQRRGVAVAVIGDNSCGACGSNLSLAQIQSARSSTQVMLCPSCGRILYGS